MVASLGLPWISGDILSGFNPLHCGAVVASFLMWVLGIVFVLCFNPLHCGAVVASSTRSSPLCVVLLVSIPFIAGQWSLQEEKMGLPFSLPEFQSPSLRGSGRFSLKIIGELVSLVEFQSPSLRGSGRFRRRMGDMDDNEILFQSPSLRGSGRFAPTSPRTFTRRLSFQSPSLRGSGRFPWKIQTRSCGRTCFNPLHCGAVVASFLRILGEIVSLAEFQSPSLRGSGRFRYEA